MTEPLNPTAYYSDTLISEEDSAPSIFALKDLKKNALQVYDRFRDIRQKMALQDYQTLLGIFKHRTQITEDNTVPLDQAQKDGNARNVQQIQSEISATYSTADDIEQTRQDGTLFYDTAKPYMPRKYSSEQATWTTNKYAEIIHNVAALRGVNENLYDAQEDIAAQVADARGTTQLAELNGYSKQLVGAGFLQRNALLQNLIDLVGVQQMRETDENLEAGIIRGNAASILVPDPYHPEKTPGYTPIESAGMPRRT